MLIWTLLIFVLVALAMVVALPVRLMAEVTSSPHRRATLRAVPLGGLGPGIRLFDSDAPKKPEKPPKPAPGKRRFRILSARMIGRIGQLIAALLRRFSLVSLDARGEIGLGDPADTGALFGLLSPLIHGVPPGGRVSLNIVPVFTHACLQGSVAARVDVTPGALLAPLARFGWQVLQDRRLAR